MDLARYVVEAVLVEGRSYREVARARTPPAVEQAIVRLRCELVSSGFDAGAATVHFHLVEQGLVHVPSVSTIWRVLKRRGFITPQPHKRPRSSWTRFEAALPNRRW